MAAAGGLSRNGGMRRAHRVSACACTARSSTFCHAPHEAQARVRELRIRLS